MGLAALALTDVAFAAIGLVGMHVIQKAGTVNPNYQKDVEACTTKGGKVSTDKEDNKICTLPESGSSSLRVEGHLGKPEPGRANVQDNAVADTGKTAKPDSDEKPGVTARTDGNRGVWKAPAGIEAQRNSDAARSNEPEWKYVPVRRLALKLEESLYRETKWVVFEPNDEPLWAKVRLEVGDYMMSLYRQGIFQGKTPKDAFFVRCDRSTMTQDDLDNGRLICLVGIAVLKPAEFEIIRISQQTKK